MAISVAHELNDADERILDLLGGGRNLPQNLARELGYSRQYVQNRLQLLKAADYVENRGGGLYELVDDPRDDADRPAEGRDTDALRERIDDLETERDRLARQLDECQDALADARAGTVDVAQLRAALDEIETAAGEGNGGALQSALNRARAAISEDDNT